MITGYHKAEGIRLDPGRIEHNPGSRPVAKLCLNTLRFGIRPILPKTKFITGPPVII